MKHIVQIIGLLLPVIFLLSCSEEKQNLSERGYPFVMHKDVAGPEPQPGEYAYFQITMRAGDSILNTSYTMSQMPRLAIPSPDAYTDETSIIIDGLTKMSVGDSLTLFFPLDSLDVKPPEFQQFDIIEYDLAMKEIKSDEAFKAEMQQIMQEREMATKAVQARQEEVAAFANENLAAYKAGRLADLQKNEMGLEFVIHKQGDGAKPQNGSTASVQYYGMLVENGTVFDHSFAEGNPYSFPIGQGRAIKGWDVGIPLLNVGGSASLFIPPDLGYGASGYMDIPGGAPLYFYVELQEVN